MTPAYRELVIGGVLIAPAVSDAGLALALFLAIRPLMRHVGFSNLFGNSAIAEFSLFVSMFGLITLMV